MPLRAVVPSLLTNRRRLLSESQKHRESTELAAADGNHNTHNKKGDKTRTPTSEQVPTVQSKDGAVIQSLCDLPVIVLQHLHPHCTFSVVDIFKVLALDNFLHNVISINASVVHPGWVTLHGILLPPEIQKKKLKK